MKSNDRAGLGKDDEGFISKEGFDFPAIVNICVIRGPCPCECVHCPIGLTPKGKRNEKFGFETMSLSLFKKIVDEIAQHPQSAVRIHAVGEPLLWKELTNALEYLKKKNIKGWIFTSAVTTDPAVLEKMIECCSIVEVSVNSISAPDYKNTKGIDEFSLVERNIKHMADYVKKHKLKTRLLASRVESTDSKKDEEFVKYWSNTGLLSDTFIRSYHNYNNVLPCKGDEKETNTITCLVHWSRFNIDANGDAVVCFNELFKGPRVQKEFVLGNINIDKIYDIWHGNKLYKIRQAQLRKDYAIVDFAKELPCVKCTSCQPLSSLRPTSDTQLKKLGC